MATWSSVSPKFWNGGIGAILAAAATPCRIAGTRSGNHHPIALGTLSTKLNAPSNFMHTLGNDCFSLGLVQIPRPFRPSLSLSLPFSSPHPSVPAHFLRASRFERRRYTWNYSGIIGMEDENTSIILFETRVDRWSETWQGGICVCTFLSRFVFY